MEFTFSIFWLYGYTALSAYSMWIIHKSNGLITNRNPLNGPKPELTPLFLGIVPIINMIITFTYTRGIVQNYFRSKAVTPREQSKFIEFYRSIKDDIKNASVKNDIHETILKYGYITKALYNKYRKDIEYEAPVVNRGQVLLDIMDGKPLPEFSRPKGVDKQETSVTIQESTNEFSQFVKEL